MRLVRSSRLLVTALTGAALSAAATCGRPATEAASGEPLRVAAAVSLTEVLSEVARRWDAAGNPRVAFNFAASNVLARQILEGAPMDAFISADEAQMDRVIASGSAEAANRVTLFTNQLVVITPSGQTLPGTPPESLGDNAVKRVAIGDPQGVPAGVYARAWLERIALWRRVEPKIVPSGSVRAALAAVEAGNADAGIVYRTDARGDPRVAVVYEVPIGDAPAIIYPGVVLTRAPHVDAARRFIAFLQSAAARDALAASGFLASDTAAAR